MSRFGRTLVIVNPAAQNGRAAQGACLLRERAADLADLFAVLDVEETQASGHATQIASEASGYDTVIALGGDGVIHEVVNGLMNIPASDRPTFGVLPCGNGNDYARTLGMTFDLRGALEQLETAQPRPTDIGECNGRYFAETLSFGLDAAIAIGTHERRKRTGRSGTRLFVEEGINQLVNHLDEYRYAMTADGEETEGSMMIFAVQIGPTYGGGFKVCPDADPADGLFDLCIARPPLGLLKAAYLFLKAKDGKHVSHTDVMHFCRASRLRIEFDDAPPAQIDGEAIESRVFDIRIHHQALNVLFA